MIEPVAPNKAELAVMRSIAQSEFAYEDTKEFCSRAGWELVTDELDVGFLQYYVYFGGQQSDRRLFAVCVREGNDEPFAFVPLYNFGEEAGEPAELDRKPFDRAYSLVATELSAILGDPHRVGTYEHAHRKGWPNSYSWWRLTDASLVLVQDEYDIQFGMDVSLWVLPTNAKVKLPVHD